MFSRRAPLFSNDSRSPILVSLLLAFTASITFARRVVWETRLSQVSGMP